MATKKPSKWKAVIISGLCVLVGVGGTIGVIKLVEHVKKTPPVEQGQTEQQPEQPTIQTSIEEQIADVAVENIA